MNDLISCPSLTVANSKYFGGNHIIKLTDQNFQLVLSKRKESQKHFNGKQSVFLYVFIFKTNQTAI